MAQLVYRTGQRRHLFAVRHLVPNLDQENSYVAGDLVAVYAATDATDVSNRARKDGLVWPPYAVVHVTGYMLAMAHQGQEGFRVLIVEGENLIHEQYMVSIVDMVRGAWIVRKLR